MVSLITHNNMRNKYDHKSKEKKNKSNINVCVNIKYLLHVARYIQLVFF